MDNRQEFRDFINEHKGEIVQIKLETPPIQNPFIRIDIEEVEIRLYDPEHPHHIVDYYEIEGDDCDMNFDNSAIWMDCYLLIPPTGGRSRMGVSIMKLKVIPSEKVLLK